MMELVQIKQKVTELTTEYRENKPKSGENDIKRRTANQGEVGMRLDRLRGRRKVEL